MKNSVNGLTFEEIFAQRGKETTASKMVVGEIYLLDQTHNYGWIKLSQYNGPANIRGIDVLSFDLYDDGDTGTGKGYYTKGVNHFYEATPDQIALLNSYK